ncbi:MAG: recombinase family protein [Firmicutes bacterium]|nr:recombinase family protein [Bacillota bacterium]
MMRTVALYARFSSDNQREESIDAQVRAIETYCQQHGMAIVRRYIDRAKSATTDKRPAFQEMIADSGKKIFDAIVVHKLDRFSRDKYDSTFYKRKLKENRVSLISLSEHLDGSPESLMLESVIEGMAQYFSANLAREVMKGMKENAHQCKHTGGKPPLGYDVDPDTRRLVTNEAEAVTVRLIFDLYLRGWGYDRILTELNARALLTKRGQPFGKNSLHDILVNEKYAGVYTFNLKASQDPFGKRNNHARKDDDSVIRIEGGVPAIVTREVFDDVQAKMSRNRRSPGAYKGKESYLLSGLIFCGECAQQDGRAYAMAGNRHVAGRNKSVYVSYRCGNRDRTKVACHNKELRRAYIERFVIDELQRRIFHDGNLSQLVQQLNAHLRASAATDQKEIKRLESELAKVSREIDNIVRAVTSGAGYAPLMEKMAELEGQRETLQSRVKQLRDARRPNAVTQEDLRALLSRFRQAIEDNDIAEMRRFVTAYVHQVMVYHDHVEVTFRMQSSGQIGTDSLAVRSASDRKELPKVAEVGA